MHHLAGMPRRRRQAPFTVLVAFRAHQTLADRLDALALALSTQMHAATRSDIARTAVELGVERLEKDTRVQQGAAGKE